MGEGETVERVPDLNAGIGTGEPGPRSEEPGIQSGESGTRSEEPGTRSEEPEIQSGEPKTPAVLTPGDPKAAPVFSSVPAIPATPAAPAVSAAPADPAADQEEPALAAVIPAYNEAPYIATVVLLARKHVDCVIVVDDGSSDKTAEIAGLAGAEVIRMGVNKGKARALSAGINHAQALGYGAVVMLDGDGQHDPDEIPAVAAPVLEGTADIVIGSRFLEIQSDIPKYRERGQRVLNGLTTAASGFDSTDSQSGFRALGRDVLASFSFTSEGYNIESDMITCFSKQGCRIVEVPISVTYDLPHSHKKNPFAHGFDVLSRLIAVIGYQRPLLFFGVPGGIVFVVGIIIEIFVFFRLFGQEVFHHIAFMGGIAALTIGLLLMLCGLILNSLVAIMKEHMNPGDEIR